MKLAELVETSRRVAEVSGRLEKIGLIAGVAGAGYRRTRSRSRSPFCPDRHPAAAHRHRLGGAPGRHGRELAAESPQLELAEVDATFERIAAVPAGKGSTAERQRLLRELLARERPRRNRTSFSAW